jgi:hypothetical protein
MVNTEVARDRSLRGSKIGTRARDASAGQGRYRVRDDALGPARGGGEPRSAGSQHGISPSTLVERITRILDVPDGTPPRDSERSDP